MLPFSYYNTFCGMKFLKSPSIAVYIQGVSAKGDQNFSENYETHGKNVDAVLLTAIEPI